MYTSCKRTSYRQWLTIKLSLKRLVLNAGLGTCDFSVFAKCQCKVAEVVDKACDYCYYLSLETLSYHDRFSPVIEGRYVKNF